MTEVFTAVVRGGEHNIMLPVYPSQDISGHSLMEMHKDLAYILLACFRMRYSNRRTRFIEKVCSSDGPFQITARDGTVITAERYRTELVRNGEALGDMVRYIIKECATFSAQN